MQKDDRRTIGGTSVHVSDIQEASIDLLQWAERRVRLVLDLGTSPLLDCASADLIATISAAAKTIAALRKKRRRACLISPDILIVLIGGSPSFDCSVRN